MAEAQLRTYNHTLPTGVAVWPFGDGRPLTERRSLAEGPRHYAFDGSGIAGYDPETGMLVDPWSDAAKSLTAGLRAGVENSAGMGGDIGGLQRQAIQWIQDKAGATQERKDKLREITSKHSMWSRLPSSEYVRSRITNPLLGEGYKPKTTLGEYLHTVGEFAGGVFIPGRALFKLGMVAGPAVASETAGQLTEGSAWEGSARFLAAMAGGGAAALARSAARKAVPADTGPRTLTPEKTGLIRALQLAGRSPDEIRRALAEFVAARAYRGAQPRPPSAELPRSADALPAFDDAAAERVAAAYEVPPAALDNWRERAAPVLRVMLDGSKPHHYVNGPAKWVGPLGDAHGPTISHPHRLLYKVEGKDKHHFTQKATVRDVPGWNSGDAPSIHAEGPSTTKGTRHYKATQMQSGLTGETVGEEILNGIEVAHATGMISTELRDYLLWESAQYAKFIGLRFDTPTRIPGNRRKPPKIDKPDEPPKDE